MGDEEITMEEEGQERTTTLQSQIERWEVRRALRRLKNNTAPDIDRVVGEILKHGGEWMEQSVEQL